MRLLKAVFINRAPFEKLVLDFDDENVSVLSGINGRGKTTILSHIVDAFYELAKKGFANEFKGRETEFYRISSYLAALNSQKVSIVYLKFKNDNDVSEYIDIRGKLTEEDYDSLIKQFTSISYAMIKDFMGDSTFGKYWNVKGNIEDNIFGCNLLTYFPAYRYETPFYLNAPYKIKLNFQKDVVFTGYLKNPIEVITGFQDVVNWIMDVVLDVRGNYGTLCNALFNEMNTILTSILSNKTGFNVRFGIGPRNENATRVQIMRNEFGNEATVYPSVFGMSSGEIALLSLFCEVLKQTDKLRKSIKNITGIVLVDEVDKHLHIKLQKETLPTLFKMFPNVQFIVTSHSPFLNMGLDECEELKYSIFDLDNDGLRCEPVNNELVKEVYDLILNQNTNYATKYQELKRTVEMGNRPLIITEGKTDWKHLVAAKRALGISDTELDIEFYEYENALGDMNLLSMLEDFARIRQTRKIIGIFDRDNSVIGNKVINGDYSYKDFGNNVYAFLIPEIASMGYGSKISIEHYYRRNDLLKEDAHSRRLFLGEEFYKTGNSIDGRYRTKYSNIQAYFNSCHIIDDKVYRADDLEESTNVALSKNDFANYIYQENEYAQGFDFNNFKMIFDVIEEICVLKDDV